MRHFYTDTIDIPLKNILFTTFILTITLTSCTTVDRAQRTGKDQQLTSLDNQKLKGTFSNFPVDTNYRFRSLYSQFNKTNSDSICKNKKCLVEIIVPRPKSIKMFLIADSVRVDSLILVGRYGKGYLKLRRKVGADFIFGPLVWVLGESKYFVGLTNSNDLVILSSGGMGILFITALPIFVAGGDRRELEFKRLK
jgi:hypothetical protein